MDSLPPEKLGCHRTGFSIPCRELVSSGQCNRWRHVIGTHPQTAQQLDMFDCADNWQMTLMIENSKLINEMIASVNSFRNEMVEFNSQQLRVSHTNSVKVIEHKQ